jgi:hypothetical protein
MALATVSKIEALIEMNNFAANVNSPPTLLGGGNLLQSLKKRNFSKFSLIFQ